MAAEYYIELLFQDGSSLFIPRCIEDLPAGFHVPVRGKDGNITIKRFVQSAGKVYKETDSRE